MDIEEFNKKNKEGYFNSIDYFYSSPKGTLDELKDFLVGKVIRYQESNVLTFPSSKNRTRHFKIEEVLYFKNAWGASWYVRGPKCSSKGKTNLRARKEEWGLRTFMEHAKKGTMVVLNSENDEDFNYVVPTGLVQLKADLNGRKAHYASVKADLELTIKQIEELEEKIKNFKDK